MHELQERLPFGDVAISGSQRPGCSLGVAGRDIARSHFHATFPERMQAQEMKNSMLFGHDAIFGANYDW